MSREFERRVRVGDQIQRVLAEEITTRMNDPRLHLLTVSHVHVSRDLRGATVYVSSMRDADGGEIERALDKASGKLRSALGKRLSLRCLPALQFKFDTHVKDGVDLVGLIDKAVASDEENRK